MKKTKGKITISRPFGPDGDFILIRISDKNSGLRITELNMSIEDYGYLISGLSNMPCDLLYENYDKTGLKKVTKDAFVDRHGVYDRDKIREIVIKDFEENHKPEDWNIWDSGIGRQQSGALHKYILVKYVEVEVEVEVEDE